MRMFGRGTWAIFGLGKESFETFIKNLYDQTLMLAASQQGTDPFGGQERIAVPGLEALYFMARKTKRRAIGPTAD